MNRPVPGASATGQIQPVTDEVVERELAALASVDISEHAARYEQLLAGLQQQLNQTGRGGQ